MWLAGHAQTNPQALGSVICLPAMCTPSHLRTHTYTYIHVHAHSYTHGRIITRVHAHARAHAHKHTHTTFFLAQRRKHTHIIWCVYSHIRLLHTRSYLHYSIYSHTIIIHILYALHTCTFTHSHLLMYNPLWPTIRRQKKLYAEVIAHFRP